MHYCGCDIVLHSVVTVSDDDEVPVISDSSSWASLYRPAEPTLADPNKAPTELAPSTLAVEEGETPSVPETPRLEPEDGATPPVDGAVGVATRIEGKEVMTQTPPLLSRLIQGYLDQTGIEACPYHQMDHGVRDPQCDHCKRALGPLYHHKIVGNRHLPVFTFDFSGPHPRKVNMAQYLLVAVWSLGHMRLLWAFGVESRQTSVVLPCLQSCFEDLRALTGGSRPPILRLHSDKASEFLSPPIRAYLSQQGVRQTVNSGYDPQANGLAERWIGIVKVRATALLADVRLPPEYWSYACRWVAYVHTHRVTEIPINKALPHFGDVVVIHQAFKKPPSFENRGSTGVCLGHDTRIAGGVLVVSVINGELKEVCSAKVRKLGERVGQAWRLHVHPQDATRSAYVNRKGEVKWNLQDLEVPTVEQCIKEDALEVQDIRESSVLVGLGLSMTCEHSFLRGKTWNLLPHLLRNHLLKLQVTYLWNPSQCVQMQRSWQRICMSMSNLWPLRLLEQWNMCLIGTRVMLCLHMSLRHNWAIGFARISVFVLFKAWGRMLLFVLKWFGVSLKMLTPIRFLNPCHAINIYTCRCTDDAFLVVVHNLVRLGTFRLRLSTVSILPW